MQELTRVVQFRNNQSKLIALPPELLTHFGIEKGDSIKYIINDDGSVNIEKLKESVE